MTKIEIHVGSHLPKTDPLNFFKKKINRLIELPLSIWSLRCAYQAPLRYLAGWIPCVPVPELPNHPGHSSAPYALVFAQTKHFAGRSGMLLKSRMSERALLNRYTLDML